MIGIFNRRSSTTSKSFWRRPSETINSTHRRESRMWSHMVVILLLVPSSSSASLTTPTFTTTVSTTPKNHYHNSYSYPSLKPTPLPKNHDHFTPSRVTFTTQPQQSNGNAAAPDRNRNYTREFVNHVTRINISNDFSQTKVGDGQLNAVVKEGELMIIWKNICTRQAWIITIGNNNVNI